MQEQDYTLGFVFNEDKTKVYLVDIDKPDGFGHNTVNGLGGKLDEKEAPVDGMIREFGEESGQPVNHWDFLGRYVGDKGDLHYTVYTFMSIVKEINLNEYEGPEGVCKWYDLDNLPDNLSSNVELSLEFCKRYIDNPELQFLLFDAI